MQVFQISNFLVLQRRPVFSILHAFPITGIISGRSVKYSTSDSHAIGKGDKHGGRWSSPSDNAISPIIYMDIDTYHYFIAMCIRKLTATTTTTTTTSNTFCCCHYLLSLVDVVVVAAAAVAVCVIWYWCCCHLDCCRCCCCCCHCCCWKQPSPFSNMHFRNTTKILQYKFFALNFVLFLLLSLFSN